MGSIKPRQPGVQTSSRCLAPVSVVHHALLAHSAQTEWLGAPGRLTTLRLLTACLAVEGGQLPVKPTPSGKLRATNCGSAGVTREDTCMNSATRILACSLLRSRRRGKRWGFR